MYCKNCGAKIDDGVNFCQSCGNALNNPVANKQHSSKLGAVNRKRLVGLVAVVVIIISILAMCSGNGNYEKTAKEFVEYMLDGNAKKCVALLTDEAVEQTGSATRKILINTMEDALEGMREEYKDKYGSKWKYEVEVIDSYAVESEYYNGGYLGETVKVVVEIHHSSKNWFNDNEGTETQTIILVNEDGKWLVAGFGF